MVKLHKIRYNQRMEKNKVEKTKLPKTMKTYQFKLLPNDNEKLIIDNSIFVKNQVRNFLIDLFSYKQDILNEISSKNKNINIKDINLDNLIFPLIDIFLS